ncbi:ABC transporter ATP-binding protein [Billgrantia kenyensis]|uniref:ATP-binding cassette domain-containing protein n=1 Tax=Billgrantia kenyensis TaxID=321266 RepID=A0A7W0AEZ2_9GAMM|nr:ATP-binding cassette domain-containing protein [Halomonas kenyensis]MBA2780084.1 ATP-binding cassette domain-containing protein [Halomonas kenyensis]MCG6661957.1 ATP-binding cassette domain-containing protein [Halomonas kenyensis]
MAETAASLALDIRGIEKSFGELQVLRGVDLSAKRGDVVSIIGSSGSGKSTFLRCLNLLERPDAGSIRVAGEEVGLRPGKQGLEPTDRRQLRRIRSELGMVFQDFNLWTHFTILQNLIEAPMRVQGLSRAEAIERAEALLDKVGLTDKRDSYPAQLSGGQQQRAAIARALAMEPAALLFDEPTSALDPELVGEVLRVMQLLAEEGCTMIVVTHEMRFAREVSSHVMFFHEGRVEEQGPPEQVFGNPNSERCRQFLSRL